MIFCMEHVWTVGCGYKYWHEIGMHDCSMFGWETWFWYSLGHNSMNLLVRSHGGASWSGRNSMDLLVRSHGGASWSRRNSMTLFGESSWWCLMVRTSFHEGFMVVPHYII